MTTTKMCWNEGTPSRPRCLEDREDAAFVPTKAGRARSTAQIAAAIVHFLNRGEILTFPTPHNTACPSRLGSHSSKGAVEPAGEAVNEDTVVTIRILPSRIGSGWT